MLNEILDMEVMIKDPEEPKEFLRKKVKLNLKMYISAIQMQMKQSFTISVSRHQLVRRLRFIGSTGSGKSTLTST